MNKETIERIIRHNRPGIAAHQIAQEMEKLENAVKEAIGFLSLALNQRDPAAKTMDVEQAEARHVWGVLQRAL